MPDKQQLHSLIDQLREDELLAALRYLEFLLRKQEARNAANAFKRTRTF